MGFSGVTYKFRDSPGILLLWSLIYAEMSPMDYLKSLIPDELLEKICDQSNNYSMQNDINKSLLLQREELEQWLGIAMQMTLTKVSNTRGHWSHHSFRQNISSIMTRQR